VNLPFLLRDLCSDRLYMYFHDRCTFMVHSMVGFIAARRIVYVCVVRQGEAC
jgi:hypothetical protein